jgi:hypothetical protein
LQDVSRLLDFCRQSIFFDTIADVAACLAAISRDSDVAIARVKNRLSPTVDSAASAGYRNVAVNLRLVTPETLSLGLESHVCEIQLILLQMALIKVCVAHGTLCLSCLHFYISVIW